MKKAGIVTLVVVLCGLAIALISRSDDDGGRKVFRIWDEDGSPESASDDAAAKGADSWALTLVNAGNPLPDDYSPELNTIYNGLNFDTRAVEQLNAMLAAMEDEGLSPVVCSAYRTREYQQTLFDNQVSKQMADGLDREQAEIEARRYVAYPGTSEHELGLAADIVSAGYQLLDDAQADTAEIKWLYENGWRYGFILRYPKGKEDITGVTYEPWHFRYVGEEAAKKITDGNLCLEEFLIP